MNCGVKPLALILARKGSKRLPGKNIRILGGKPMLGMAVAVALESGCFEDVLVSTDCPEIARIAREYGAGTPFMRPAALASDGASSEDSVLHAVKWLRDNEPDKFPEIVCLIQATSPFLSCRHIEEALKTFIAGNFTSLHSMCPISEPPQWMFSVDMHNRAVPLDPIGVEKNRSELPQLFRQNGALFVIRSSYLLQTGRLIDPLNHGAYIMSIRDSLDIDTPDDWEIASMRIDHR